MMTTNSDYKFRVYYEDTDTGGVVYHARYLAFAERARSEGLRNAGLGPAAIIEKYGVGFVVRELSIRFIRPLKLEDAGSVTTAVTTYGKASVKLEQTIFYVDEKTGEKTKSATLLVDLVAINVDNNKPTKIPDECMKVMQNSWENR